MGSWRLILFFLVACGGASVRPPDAVHESGPHHTQVIHTAHTDTRKAFVDRLRERDGAWVVKPEEIDGIRLVLRHGVRTDAPGKAIDPSDEEASRVAVSFVTKCADFFGLAPGDVQRLDVEMFPTNEGRHAKVIRLSGTLPMPGYESFESLQSVFELVIFVDDDGVVREVKNLSRVHPRLSLDTHPLLGPSDPELLKSVVGREVFAVYDDPRRPNRNVRELRREKLGPVEPTDVVARTLTVQVARGPFDAFVSYHLAYAIDVGRGGYWFRFIVDADTGDLLDDASAPVVSGP